MTAEEGADSRRDPRTTRTGRMARTARIPGALRGIMARCLGEINVLFADKSVHPMVPWRLDPDNPAAVTQYWAP